MCRHAIVVMDDTCNFTPSIVSDMQLQSRMTLEVTSLLSDMQFMSLSLATYKTNIS